MLFQWFPIPNASERHPHWPGVCAKWWPVQMANHRKTMGLWGLSLVFRSFPFKSQELVKVFYLVLPCSGLRNLEPKSSGVHLWYFMIFLVVQLPYRPEVCKAWLIPIRQWSRTSSGGMRLPLWVKTHGKKSQVILSKAPLESIPMSSFRSFSESLVKSYPFLHHKPS